MADDSLRAGRSAEDVAVDALEPALLWQLQRRVANEEVGHVAFGVRWFERWTGGQDFDTWVRALPPPLTPLLMRGPWVDAEERARAGMAPAFVEALAAFQPVEA
jgi:uncharacterized ferritin-like protein (DUF455 family)